MKITRELRKTKTQGLGPTDLSSLAQIRQELASLQRQIVEETYLSLLSAHHNPNACPSIRQGPNYELFAASNRFITSDTTLGGLVPHPPPKDTASTGPASAVPYLPIPPPHREGANTSVSQGTGTVYEAADKEIQATVSRESVDLTVDDLPSSLAVSNGGEPNSFRVEDLTTKVTIYETAGIQTDNGTSFCALTSSSGAEALVHFVLSLEQVGRVAIQHEQSSLASLIYLQKAEITARGITAAEINAERLKVQSYISLCRDEVRCRSLFNIDQSRDFRLLLKAEHTLSPCRHQEILRECQSLRNQTFRNFAAQSLYLSLHHKAFLAVASVDESLKAQKTNSAMADQLLERYLNGMAKGMVKRGQLESETFPIRLAEASSRVGLLTCEAVARCTLTSDLYWCTPVACTSVEPDVHYGEGGLGVWVLNALEQRTRMTIAYEELDERKEQERRCEWQALHLEEQRCMAEAMSALGSEVSDVRSQLQSAQALDRRTIIEEFTLQLFCLKRRAFEVAERSARAVVLREWLHTTSWLMFQIEESSFRLTVQMECIVSKPSWLSFTNTMAIEEAAKEALDRDRWEGMERAERLSIAHIHNQMQQAENVITVPIPHSSRNIPIVHLLSELMFQTNSFVIVSIQIELLYHNKVNRLGTPVVLFLNDVLASFRLGKDSPRSLTVAIAGAGNTPGWISVAGTGHNVCSPVGGQRAFGVETGGATTLALPWGAAAHIETASVKDLPEGIPLLFPRDMRLPRSLPALPTRNILVSVSHVSGLPLFFTGEFTLRLAWGGVVLRTRPILESRGAVLWAEPFAVAEDLVSEWSPSGPRLLPLEVVVESFFGDIQEECQDCSELRIEGYKVSSGHDLSDERTNRTMSIDRESLDSEEWSNVLRLASPESPELRGATCPEPYWDRSTVQSLRIPLGGESIAVLSLSAVVM